MALSHQIARSSAECPRCGKPYTVGREIEHHCGKQIGEERLAPPGVIVDHYRRAMGLPPAKDAPASVHSAYHDANRIAVSTPLAANRTANRTANSGSANKSVSTPVAAEPEEVTAEPPGDSRQVRRAYQRDLMRKRRAAKKAAAESEGSVHNS